MNERQREPQSERLDEQVLASVRRLLADEPRAIVAARNRAADLAGLPDPEVGALLRWAVHLTDARNVVEVGAAGGISGAWLLTVLPGRGVLTSIEEDPHGHALATETLAEVERDDAVTAKARTILGRPATVLPRLTDGAYDLVLLQATPALTPEQLGHVRRLLRPGGMLVARGVLRSSEHAELVAQALAEVGEDDTITATLLPVDGGLLLASLGA